VTTIVQLLSPDTSPETKTKTLVKQVDFGDVDPSIMNLSYYGFSGEEGVLGTVKPKSYGLGFGPSCLESFS